jgi:mono/diheme cytochrome c family protein
MRFPKLPIAAAWVATVWLAAACGGDDGATPTPELEGAAARGQELVETRGCGSCHSTDGSDGTGPTWANLAGSEVELADGTTVTADDEYLARSIVRPDADVVAGYPEGLMSSAAATESITSDEADAIVAYLRTLSDLANAEETGEQGGDAG